MSEVTLCVADRARAARRRGVPASEMVPIARKWFDTAQEALDERERTARWRFLRREKLAAKACDYFDALTVLSAVYPEVIRDG